MKKGRMGITLLLLCGLICCLTGCAGGETWKDNILEGFNDWLQSFSGQALTRERDLKGERDLGKDGYTGSYSAQYREFYGEEYLFGGTALEREEGSRLTVAYELDIASGSAKLYWLKGGETYTIAEEDGSSRGTLDISLAAGDNYIILEGKDLDGSLVLEVE